MKQFVMIISLVFYITQAQAQKEISYQTHGWIMYFGNHKLTDKLSLHTEYQFRRADGFRDWQQSLTRVGLDYKVKDNLTATIGYGYIVTHPYGEQPIPSEFHEHRIWQTVTVTQRIGRFYLGHRYRLEQRWLEDKVQNQTTQQYNHAGYTFRQRFRYRFLLTLPLTKPNLDPGCIFASVYDEPFLQFGKNFGLNYLDQNRLYAALGYVVNSHCNIQAGYMNQYIVKSNAERAESNHTMQIAITYNFDLRKKQEIN
ncbi:MAG: DUF2490 domain-containing protein [Cyclobacteriaceae bacterium]|jgi:hypothetical protein|nr:DUF2490 domain-containing protein [Cyclobacteriaceae bacterium]